MEADWVYNRWLLVDRFVLVARTGQAERDNRTKPVENRTKDRLLEPGSGEAEVETFSARFSDGRQTTSQKL